MLKSDHEFMKLSKVRGGASSLRIALTNPRDLDKALSQYSVLLGVQHARDTFDESYYRYGSLSAKELVEGLQYAISTGYTCTLNEMVWFTDDSVESTRSYHQFFDIDLKCEPFGRESLSNKEVFVWFVGHYHGFLK